MKMKKWTRCIWAAVVVFGMSSTVRASDDLNVAATADFYSKYIWRGQNLLDGPAFQPSVSVGSNGFTGAVWGSLDLTDDNDNRGEFTEADYSLDYSNSLFEGINYSIGTIYYDFPNTHFASTTEVYAGLQFDLPFSPAVKIFQDVDEADGSYIQFSIGHIVEKLAVFSEDCYCGLNLGAAVGYGTSNYNDFYFGVDAGQFNDLTLSAALPICFKNGWVVKPSVNYAMMLSDRIRTSTAHSDNVWTGISISKSF